MQYTPLRKVIGFSFTFSDSDSNPGKLLRGIGDKSAPMIGVIPSAEVLGTPGAKLDGFVALAEINCKRPLKVFPASGLACSSDKDWRSISAPISFHGIWEVWVSYSKTSIKVECTVCPNKFGIG